MLMCLWETQLAFRTKMASRSITRPIMLCAFCCSQTLSQEDKETMFDCFDILHGALQVTTGVMSTLKVSVVEAYSGSLFVSCLH